MYYNMQKRRITPSNKTSPIINLSFAMRGPLKGRGFPGTSARIAISALFVNLKLQLIGYLHPGSRSLRYALVAYPTMRDRRSGWNSALYSEEEEHMPGLDLGMQICTTKAGYMQLGPQDNCTARLDSKRRGKATWVYDNLFRAYCRDIDR